MSSKFCMHCGNALQPGQKFCPVCGKPTEAEPIATEPVKAESVVTEPAKAEPKTEPVVENAVPAEEVRPPKPEPKPKKEPKAKKPFSKKKLIIAVAAVLVVAILGGTLGILLPKLLSSKPSEEGKKSPSSGSNFNETVVIPIVSCEVDVPSGAIPGDPAVQTVSKDGGIEITVPGMEHVELEMPATVRFTIENSVSVSDVDHYVAVYIDGKGREFYYTPDREQLQKGVVEFETCHFSLWKVKKLSDEEQAEKAAAELAAKDVVQQQQEEANKNLYWPYMTELYKKMGITDDTVAGKLARTALDKLGNKIEDDQVKTAFAHKLVTMSTLMADGDMSGMCGLLSQVAYDSMAENFGELTKKYGSALAGALPGAVYTALVEEKPAEAAADVMKAIAVTCCPAVTYYQLAADLADMAVETWKDGEMERLYLAYRGDEIEGLGGFNNGKHFDEVISENARGVFYQYKRDYKKNFCATYGFSPDDLDQDEELRQRVEKHALDKLEADFKARLEQDTEISKKKQEYLTWIKACREYDRQNPDAYVKLITRTTISSGFGPYDDMGLRVRRLTNIKERILQYISQQTDGATLEQFFETSNVDKQNQELAHLVWLYISSSNSATGLEAVDNSYYFQKWYKEHPQTEGKWVLVDIVYDEFPKDVDYTETGFHTEATFSGTGTSMSVHHIANGFLGDRSSSWFAVDFNAHGTFTGIPTSVKVGENFKVTASASFSGNYVDVPTDEYYKTQTPPGQMELDGDLYYYWNRATNSGSLRCSLIADNDSKTGDVTVDWDKKTDSAALISYRQAENPDDAGNCYAVVLYNKYRCGGWVSRTAKTILVYEWQEVKK